MKELEFCTKFTNHDSLEIKLYVLVKEFKCRARGREGACRRLTIFVK